eukprot:GHVT01094555.1.p3 GENE.GHVT01094555.1~~GHVT01094555.1.p3  ORF type:complete len:114 (-),score=21.34 GHVT01094555.1:280-621(-)
MVKNAATSSSSSCSGLKKVELMEILTSSKASTKEKNRAAKLLKKFDPTPHKELDDEFEMKKAKIKKYETIQSFVCWRCDKVKQTNVKCAWSTTKGKKKLTKSHNKKRRCVKTL